MLVLNPKALCNTCLKNLSVKQVNENESQERWTCPAYPNRIPGRITVRAQKCKHYEGGIDHA
jgi:hypothetical protein